LEPVVGNSGFIAPTKEFLQGLRKLCDEHGAVLVFDEVMTGFRIAYGGAQAHFGVTPDVTTMGKVIGGGLPVGAYGMIYVYLHVHVVMHVPYLSLFFPRIVHAERGAGLMQARRQTLVSQDHEEFTQGASLWSLFRLVLGSIRVCDGEYVTHTKADIYTNVYINTQIYVHGCEVHRHEWW